MALPTDEQAKSLLDSGMLKDYIPSQKPLPVLKDLRGMSAHEVGKMLGEQGFETLNDLPGPEQRYVKMYLEQIQGRTKGTTIDALIAQLEKGMRDAKKGVVEEQPPAKKKKKKKPAPIPKELRKLEAMLITSFDQISEIDYYTVWELSKDRKRYIRDRSYFGVFFAPDSSGAEYLTHAPGPDGLRDVVVTSASKDPNDGMRFIQKEEQKIIEDNLTKHALLAFETLRRPDDSPSEISTSVAIAVGGYAARKDISYKAVQEWLQSAYGAVFVRMNNLNPGLGLKEISRIIEAQYKRARKL